MRCKGSRQPGGAGGATRHRDRDAAALTPGLEEPVQGGAWGWGRAQEGQLRVQGEVAQLPACPAAPPALLADPGRVRCLQSSALVTAFATILCCLQCLASSLVHCLGKNLSACCHPLRAWFHALLQVCKPGIKCQGPSVPTHNMPLATRTASDTCSPEWQLQSGRPQGPGGSEPGWRLVLKLHLHFFGGCVNVWVVLGVLVEIMGPRPSLSPLAVVRNVSGHLSRFVLAPRPGCLVSAGTQGSRRGLLPPGREVLLPLHPGMAEAGQGECLQLTWASASATRLCTHLAQNSVACPETFWRCKQLVVLRTGSCPLMLAW